MKKVLFLLITSVFMFAACNKDDDDPSDAFVGTWVSITDTTTKYTYDGSGNYQMWKYNGRKAEVEYKGTWHYTTNGNSQYIGYLSREYWLVSSPSKHLFSGSWVIFANGDSFITESETTEGQNRSFKYVKHENAVKTYSTSTTDNSGTVSYVEDEDTEIKVTLTTSNVSTNEYKCSVNVTGAKSSDIEEIGIKFCAATSNETPNLLFGTPDKETTSYTRTNTIAISQKIIGYVLIDGKYYKSEIKTIKATPISKKTENQ